MSRQCPSCRAIVDFRAAKCADCGLQFYERGNKPASFSATCLRIGSWFFLLAIVTLAVMKFT